MVAGVSGQAPALRAAGVASAWTSFADERRAEATYVAHDAKLGATSPVGRIVDAERRHAAALEALLATHALPLPAADAVAPGEA